MKNYKYPFVGSMFPNTKADKELHPFTGQFQLDPEFIPADQIKQITADIKAGKKIYMSLNVRTAKNGMTFYKLAFGSTLEDK